MSASTNHASSSSSEDEAENQRLLDAVWDHNRRDEANVRPTQSGRSEENSRPRQMIISKPSVREMIYQESHDQFNEDHKNVKATPEFRSFVAKKLSSVLDGKLKMTVSNKQKTFHNDCCEEMEEDNFRLFSTSCCAPNLHTPEAPPPPVKRKRPRIGRNTKKISQANHYDSSDSDVEDQRLAEAAISGHQILSFSAMSTSSGHNVEKVECSSDDDNAFCLDSKKSKTESAFIKSDFEIKDRELSKDDFSETAKKKKKRKDDTHVQIDVELSEKKDEGDLSEELVKRKKRKKKRKKVAVNANKEDNHEHPNIENC